MEFEDTASLRSDQKEHSPRYQIMSITEQTFDQHDENSLNQNNQQSTIIPPNVFDSTQCQRDS